MRFFIFLLFLGFMWNGVEAQSVQTAWPAINRETKPWTRWWWHGSALTKEGITIEMEAYKRAGLGGLEITPIYGVYGAEKQFINYLTPQWMGLLMHTLKEAERLDIGIDMATGTGWPFGGPWVTDSDACKNIEFKIYTLREGERLREKIVFLQQPYVRAVGNQIYEVHDSTLRGETAKGALKEPLLSSKEEIKINQLIEPISANKNLQGLALDQVKFEKPLPLQTVMAYSDAGEVLDLTIKVSSEGTLDWKAPKGNWKLYAVFSGWHGKMVERAGPGGEGNVIDHFSAQALKNYLQYFDAAFKGYDLNSLRAFFNDSYEVDDARGAADWTPSLFDEFKKRRGYDLKEHLPALFAQDEDEKNKRVLCDYRETISELVLENFTRQWKTWAHQHKALVRNQAHGSPSNILDLYATVDIPEIEGVEPLRIKMASSAGHVTGKKLISSESATWLNEHFESTLSDIKAAVDRFMLHGVNHIFYHGTSYSPPGEPWPGRLFYAAVHLNPRNSLWPHFAALNKYVERSQSLLQNTKPDNDVLLYYSIYDRFSAPGEEMIEHFDGVGAQFENTSFKRAAETMLTQGYAFDYISDKQLEKTQTETEHLLTEGNSIYQTLVLPRCQFIPVNTFKKIISLVEAGATIIAFDGLPASVSGYSASKANKKFFEDFINTLKVSEAEKEIKIVNLGKGRIVMGSNIEKLLSFARIRREPMVKQGIQFIRKKKASNESLYFVSNGSTPFEGWLLLQAKGEAGVLYDPMAGDIGVAKTRKSTDGFLEVFVQLKPLETLLIEVHPKKIEGVTFNYVNPVGEPLELKGTWNLAFIEGGPQLPPGINLKSLASWNTFNNPLYHSFSGTASYTLSFQKPMQKASGWLLDLGEVKESAAVVLNGKSLGILIGPVFQVYIDDAALKRENKLEVSVCNLMANRIAYMDKQGIFWKKFYNVNFPARKSENRKHGIFDASEWKFRDSGLIGPVRLGPIQ